MTVISSRGGRPPQQETAAEYSDRISAMIVRQTQQFLQRLATVDAQAAAMTQSRLPPKLGIDADEVFENLEALIGMMFTALVDGVDAITQQRTKLIALAIDNRTLNDSFNKVINVDYTEELNEATRLLMDLLVADGHADVDANNSIRFDADTALSHQELKPILRSTIDGWINARLAAP